MGEWRYSCTILNFGTGRSWVVSFTPRPFYTRGNSPLYPLDRRLGGSQSRYGRRGEETNLAPAGNRTPAVQPLSPSLYWLSYPGSHVKHVGVENCEEGGPISEQGVWRIRSDQELWKLYKTLDLLADIKRRELSGSNKGTKKIFKS
jgi:hypothetical protein